MKPVGLTGLNNRDVALCQRLWQLDTQHQVKQYIEQLSPGQQQRASLLMELMHLEVIDNSVQDVTIEVQELLSRF
jgi:ABC-type lipoprotein export system ATPase subunit